MPSQPKAKKLTTNIRRLFTLYDQMRVRDWAGLSDRQKEIFTGNIIRNESLQQTADRLGVSYSLAAKESQQINIKIRSLFSDLRTERDSGGDELAAMTGLDIGKVQEASFLCEDERILQKG